MLYCECPECGEMSCEVDTSRELQRVDCLSEDCDDTSYVTFNPTTKTVTAGGYTLDTEEGP